MSNRNRRTAAARTSAAKPQSIPPMPTPHGPGYQRGRQMASEALGALAWDEMADFIAGFKATMIEELGGRGQKLKEQERHVDAALNALEA